jgi:hypothetical protein
MADTQSPVQRQRAERRALGWRDVNIWLTPEGQARVTRLQEPGESLSTLIERALVALDTLHGGMVETRRPHGLTSEPSSEMTSEASIQTLITREVSRCNNPRT